ncbi:DUF6223 family protein [Micromonospora sp. BRA006-A]|nr:DUF6223 family protein [Micromonospora sp. BRA006-A]
MPRPEESQNVHAPARRRSRPGRARLARRRWHRRLRAPAPQSSPWWAWPAWPSAGWHCAARRGPGEGRVQAPLAAAAGLVSLVLSVWHLALTTEGLGSGQGRAGAVAGVAFGLIGAVLGGLALARSRRTA